MRSGLVAQKVGMSRILSDSGESIPVTLVKIFECSVVEHKVQSVHGYNAVKVAYGSRKLKHVSKPMQGVFAKLGREPSRGLSEFRVTEDQFLEVGSKVLPDHFQLGQFVDVTGVSIGKGFAGSMKRHNFGGLRATHGVSVSHRSHGSTGNRQDPGRVFKSKKMAGHMGQVKVTVQNLKVVFIDSSRGIIAVKGAVPGASGGTLWVRDAVKKKIMFQETVA